MSNSTPLFLPALLQSPPPAPGPAFPGIPLISVDSSHYNWKGILLPPIRQEPLYFSEYSSRKALHSSKQSPHSFLWYPKSFRHNISLPIDRQISICPISPFPSNKYILWISESGAFCVRLIPFRICLCYHTIVTHEKRKRQEPPTKVCFLPFMNTAAIHKDEDHQ